jgi:hypothetical protein
MSFNSVVATFTTLLNRDDMTASQANVFVQQSINRIQREMRLPCMERTQLITSQSAITWIPVPQDLLGLQDIVLPDLCGIPRPLIKKPYRQIIQYDPNCYPSTYGRFQNQFFFGGTVGPGTTVQVCYWGEFTPITDPTQDNEITVSQADLIVYGALSYAGDFFESPNTDRWEAKYEGIRESIKALAEDLETNGGPAAVQAMYNEYCEGDWP